MFTSPNKPTVLTIAVSTAFIAALAIAPLAAAQEHEHGKQDLTASADKTVTIKGKVAERGGMVMLENAEVVKK